MNASVIPFPYSNRPASSLSGADRAGEVPPPASPAIYSDQSVLPALTAAGGSFDPFLPPATYSNIPERDAFAGSAIFHPPVTSRDQRTGGEGTFPIMIETGHCRPSEARSAPLSTYDAWSVSRAEWWRV